MKWNHREMLKSVGLYYRSVAIRSYFYGTEIQVSGTVFAADLRRSPQIRKHCQHQICVHQRKSAAKTVPLGFCAKRHVIEVLLEFNIGVANFVGGETQ